MQVKDVTVSLKRVDTIAHAHESLLADSKVSEDAESRNVAQVVLRVPTQQLTGERRYYDQQISLSTITLPLRHRFARG